MRYCRGLLLVMFVISIIGCSPTKYVYREIEKDKETYNVQIFSTSSVDLNKAIVEMLLGKKFVIEHEDPVQGMITAKRIFSKSYQNVAVLVQTRVVSEGEKSQKLYINGVQTTERNYVADRTRFFLWIVPLPGGGGKEVTKSKESEIIIEDKRFYADLFDSIRQALPVELKPEAVMNQDSKLDAEKKVDLE